MLNNRTSGVHVSFDASSQQSALEESFVLRKWSVSDFRKCRDVIEPFVLPGRMKSQYFRRGAINHSLKIASNVNLIQDIVSFLLFLLTSWSRAAEVLGRALLDLSVDLPSDQENLSVCFLFESVAGAETWRVCSVESCGGSKTGVVVAAGGDSGVVCECQSMLLSFLRHPLRGRGGASLRSSMWHSLCLTNCLGCAR